MDTIVLIMFASVISTMTALSFIELRRAPGPRRDGEKRNVCLVHQGAELELSFRRALAGARLAFSADSQPLAGAFRYWGISSLRRTGTTRASSLAGRACSLRNRSLSPADTPRTMDEVDSPIRLMSPSSASNGTTNLRAAISFRTRSMAASFCRRVS